MKQFLPILILVCSAWAQVAGEPRPSLAQAPAATSPSPATQAQPSSQPRESSSAVPADQANANQAKAVLEQAIQALGGQAYLTIRDREQQGRSYGFHHGRASGGGVAFWSFTEFPDKERVELTKERDVAELYVGNKGWELTYKGAHPIEEKDRIDYLRRRRFSLDTVLRTWVNDPTVVLLFEGAAIAAQHPATAGDLDQRARRKRDTLHFDSRHAPAGQEVVRLARSGRPAKKSGRRSLRKLPPVSGVMAPYNVTRFFNGDMASQRFLNSVTINQGLDQAMFDPNSGYDPNKPAGKQAGKR